MTRRYLSSSDLEGRAIHRSVSVVSSIIIGSGGGGLVISELSNGCRLLAEEEAIARKLLVKGDSIASPLLFEGDECLSVAC